MSRFRVALALAGFLCAQPSRADPVAVTSGSVYIEPGDNNEFVFNTALSPYLGGVITDLYPGNTDVFVVPPGSAFGCNRFTPCFSGDRLSLTVTDLGRGFAYTSSDLEHRPMSVVFQFTTGEMLLDGGSVGAAGLQTPFAFSGLVRIYSDFSFADVLSGTDFTGGGTVQASFFQPGALPVSPSGPFLLDEVHYRFAAPVPEPATIVLLTTGLVSACVLRRARRRRGAAVID